MNDQYPPKTGRAAAYRKSQGEEVLLPSGNQVLLRRPPLQVWLSNGRLPQAITAAAIEAVQNGAEREEAHAQVVARVVSATPEEQQATLKFMVDVVSYAFVSPKLVIGATGDDELDPSELEEGDFDFVFKWATRSVPEMPVGKEATVETVKAFREGGSGQPPADAGGDVPNVSDANAEPGLRAVG